MTDLSTVTAPAPEVVEPAHAEVLRYVNRTRAEFDLSPLDELPKGCRGNGTECVLARAIPNAIVGGYTLRVGGVERGMPDWVQAFVKDFDHDMHPDLIDYASECTLDDEAVPF